MNLILLYYQKTCNNLYSWTFSKFPVHLNLSTLPSGCTGWPVKRKVYPTYFHQASLCPRVTVWPGLKISSVSESWQLQLDLDRKIGSKNNVRACNLSPLRGCPSRQGYYLLFPWISKAVFSHGSNPLTPESNSPSLTLSKLVFLWVNCQVSASNLRDIYHLSAIFRQLRSTLSPVNMYKCSDLGGQHLQLSSVLEHAASGSYCKENCGT